MFSINPDEARRAASSLEQARTKLGRVRGILAEFDVSRLMGGNAIGTVQSSIDQIEEAVGAKERNLSAMSQTLFQISNLYMDADQKVTSLHSNSIAHGPEQSGNQGNLASSSALFDEEGGYGGDQGNMAHSQSGFQFLWWRLFENEELFNLVKTYEGYETYSDSQIANLFSRTNSEGCGYVAIVNSILMQYESDPIAFERDFGFPMFDNKGEFNYNRLLIDFYCNTDDKYYLNEVSGRQALVNDILSSYENHPQDFVNRYGIELYADDGNYSIHAKQAIADEYQDQHIVTYEMSGTNRYSLENRVRHYLNTKGINVTCETYDSMTTAEIRRELDNGKCVNIRSEHFTMYDSEGNVIGEDVGGHRMTVTGVTDDGNLVVSSWGGKYYLHPDELPNPNVLVMDI